jgi:hypothetical protein
MELDKEGQALRVNKIVSAPQQFGNFWTVQKLDAVEKYLEFYTTALKKQAFRLCYIDAFSGSGNVMLKDGQVVDGSAIRALKYPWPCAFRRWATVNIKMGLILLCTGIVSTNHAPGRNRPVSL